MVSFEQWRQAEDTYRGSPPVRMENRATLFYRDAKADVAFRCKGHSMEPTFYDGELAFIHQQETFSDGQIVAVCIESGMTLKRLYRLPDGFLLVPDNKRFKPLRITGNDAENLKVYGVAVARK